MEPPIAHSLACSLQLETGCETDRTQGLFPAGMSSLEPNGRRCLLTQVDRYFFLRTTNFGWCLTSNALREALRDLSCPYSSRPPPCPWCQAKLDVPPASPASLAQPKDVNQGRQVRWRLHLAVLHCLRIYGCHQLHVSSCSACGALPTPQVSPPVRLILSA